MLAAGALVIAGAAGWKSMRAPAAPAYTPVTVRRGDLAKTISATGKVQAVVTVQVGTQVSGTVSELHADFNDHVRAGQVIARLDPSEIQAQLQQAKATLASAQARVAAARSSGEGQSAAIQASKASIDNANAALLEAERNYKTTEALVQEGVMARRTLETAEATRNQAQAQKAQVEAQYRQSQAQGQASGAQVDQALADATQAKAAVDAAQVNLERTYIRSPIDGVVIARNVDVGQTVASSLQAPTLFLIAKDLTKMQVLADVDEADVGQLQPNTPVTFTVDAFPQETFSGTVSQVRLSPNVVQNVVTYTAVIDVANPDLKLKPGMTATITAAVQEKHGVLMVPNAALRFRPQGARPPAARPDGAQKAEHRNSNGAMLWKVEGNQLKPVRVQLGMTDGASTEVIGTELVEGDQVATAGQTPGVPARNNTASPFGGQGAGRRVRM
jgi:HlyD family secretion protein